MHVLLGLRHLHHLLGGRRAEGAAHRRRQHRHGHGAARGRVPPEGIEPNPVGVEAGRQVALRGHQVDRRSGGWGRRGGGGGGGGGGDGGGIPLRRPPGEQRVDAKPTIFVHSAISPPCVLTRCGRERVRN